MDSFPIVPSILRLGRGERKREREGLIIGQPVRVIAQFNFSRESKYLILFGNVRKSIKIPGNFIQLGDIRIRMNISV